jgi:hypothetical protein
MLAPPQHRDATRRRQARWRARHRKGRAIFRLEPPHNRVVEALIVSGRLSENAAPRRSEVERALAAVALPRRRQP